MNSEDSAYLDVKTQALICHCCIDYNKVILKNTSFNCVRGLKISANFQSNLIEQATEKTDEDMLMVAPLISNQIDKEAIKQKTVAAILLAQEEIKQTIHAKKQETVELIIKKQNEIKQDVYAQKQEMVKLIVEKQKEIKEELNRSKSM
jgi:hypothetical protein